jgi:hypothetical protein
MRTTFSLRRASADYRQHLAVTLFKDTLEFAWERAEEKTTETRRYRESKLKTPCFRHFEVTYE